MNGIENQEERDGRGEEEEPDLEALARVIVGRLAPHRREGYVRGKTALRDELSSELGCSIEAAEQIVDTMELRRIVRFTGDPSAADGSGAWILGG